MTPRPITAKQREVLDYIVQAQRRGWTPALHEMRVVLGYRTANAVRAKVLALEKKGFLSRVPGSVRSVIVIDTGRVRTLWGDFELDRADP